MTDAGHEHYSWVTATSLKIKTLIMHAQCAKIWREESLGEENRHDSTGR